MPDTYLPGDTRQRIQDLIKNRKITQTELAEKVGLSNSALSRYLQRRTKNLGDGFIIRIAKYFDVSTDFLLGETDIPERKNYDIEELGLSAETAKLLYPRKVNARLHVEPAYCMEPSGAFLHDGSPSACGRILANSVPRARSYPEQSSGRCTLCGFRFCTGAARNIRRRVCPGHADSARHIPTLS